jgi:exonuclease SbcD
MDAAAGGDAPTVTDRHPTTDIACPSGADRGVATRRTALYGQPALRFVHAADLHIDSPLVGLACQEGATVAALRIATRTALENLVGLCIDREASFLVVAGDLFDGAWKDFGTGLFFVRQMARLRAADIPVVVARGNHDAESRIPRYLSLPDNVHVLDHERPSRVELEDLGVAIHGQSYPAVRVDNDLTAKYPLAVGGTFNVGVLHTALDGRPGHDTYAPTTTARLVDKGYDYWALGHVHTREVVSKSPWILFPGNLQGRHVRERGAKGATLVEVRDRTVVDASHVPLDVVRFERIHVSVPDDAGADDAMDLAREQLRATLAAIDGRMLAADVVFESETRTHSILARDPERTESDMRAVALDVAADEIWVTRVQTLARRRPDAAVIAGRTDALGRLLHAARAAGSDPSEAEALFVAAGLRATKLDAEIVVDAIPPPEDPIARARFFADVEDLLADRLGSRS